MLFCLAMVCPDCGGTGWRPIAGDAAHRVERCGCWRHGQAARLLQDARIDPRYGRCTLDGLTVYANEHLQNAIAKAKRFVRDFPAVQKGLILTGPPGIGKTHIAVAVLRQLVIEKQVHGVFYDVPNLLRVIRSTYNPVVRTAQQWADPEDALVAQIKESAHVTVLDSREQGSS